MTDGFMAKNCAIVSLSSLVSVSHVVMLDNAVSHVVQLATSPAARGLGGVMVLLGAERQGITVNDDSFTFASHLGISVPGVGDVRTTQ